MPKYSRGRYKSRPSVWKRPGMRAAAFGVGQMVGQAYRWYRGNGAETHTRGGSSGVVTTANYDRSLQYRKSKMPRYKKKSWKKFVKKVQAVQAKTLGTRTILKNTQATLTVSAAQNFYAVHLYGSHGTDGANDTGAGDIFSVVNNDGSIDTAGKCTFGSGVMDVTLRNSGTGPTEIDLYEVWYNSETKNASFAASHTVATAATGTIGFATALSLGTRGATLFDIPQLIKILKMKIIKKTKVFLPAGNVTTYQIRDPRNHIIDYQDIVDTTGYVRPKITKSLIIIGKNCTGVVEDQTIQIGSTRKYMYNINEDDKDADGLL